MAHEPVYNRRRLRLPWHNVQQIALGKCLLPMTWQYLQNMNSRNSNVLVGIVGSPITLMCGYGELEFASQRESLI